MGNCIERAEVLAPAGDMEKFYAAVNFGANAVYLGGTAFGMRASAASFDKDALKQAIDYAHKNSVKVYVTCNTLPRNNEICEFPDYIKTLSMLGADAVIVSDIGVFSLVKKYAPEMEIHISTQAGIVNYQTANEFYKMGAKRVVLARELSLEEIAEIREKTPPDLEIEAFVHGAMCMSFSGRCLISNYMLGRDANRGECAQPCRWSYYLVEEKRPNEYYNVFEDDKGSYILNAKDLCMIEHVDKLIKAGVTSLKIEGRAKSSYYVSVITNAYRIAVDEYYKDPDNFVCPEWLKEEVTKVSHRQYYTGFFFGKPSDGQYYENGGYIRNYDVVAVLDECKGGYLYCTQRNKFSVNDKIELLQPGNRPVDIEISEIIELETGESVQDACHPMAKIKIPCSQEFKQGSILRKANN